MLSQYDYDIIGIEVSLLNGTIFTIEEFSVYDGPGIRTTVFLKGCPLRCQWCHNPEGQLAECQIVRSPNGCIRCGNCTKNTVYTKDGNMAFTNESIENCPMNLLRWCGEKVDSKELCEKLLKNKKILNNGGGITFSGGEPLMQSDFVFECLKILKEDVHTALQTSGYCEEDIFANALALADYFLFDLKLYDDAMHKKYTGGSNIKILNNFYSLARSKKDFTIRIPLIPGVTDTYDNIYNIANLLRENKVFYAELLPYNKVAGGKYKMLQREYKPDFDEGADVDLHQEIFERAGIEIKVM